MLKRFFSPYNHITVRTPKGERRMFFSHFHKYLVVGVLAFGFVTICMLASQSLYTFLSPSTPTQIDATLQKEYEARIDSLVNERDGLITKLQSSKVNEARLIENLSSLQGLLFDIEREKYELTANVTAIRSGLVSKQNSLDALNLQLEAQKEQLASALNGEAVTGNNTLSTITQTLAETAISRDQAREQVQLLRDQIQRAESDQIAREEKRDILFAQIEDAVEESLLPLETTLSKTGLNVDSLLNDIRKSYSGIGGIDSDASFNLFGGSSSDESRVNKLISDLDNLALYSYALRSLPVANPVKANYRMSSGFGYRIHPISGVRKMHTGQDMAGPVGTPIYAGGAGKVISAGWTGGYGRAVRIQHASGVVTLYAHMSKLLVNAGQDVALGQQIGKMGSTGNSTGSHLHYEISINGKTVNPMNFMRASSYVY